jgi:hypothetical protein
MSWICSIAQHIRNLPALALRLVCHDLVSSVHPPALPTYNSSKLEVDDFLKNLGYKIEMIAIDHDEHWCCWFR